jgi:arginine-tRNA-protein transferase
MHQPRPADEHAACDYPAWRPPVAVRTVSPPASPCVYLPGRMAQMRAFHADMLSPRLYHEFMNRGFRRSGKVIYQPICAGCRRCLPIRVPIDPFQPSKSQRRCGRRNSDLVIDVHAPESTDEKFDLYRRYQLEWHKTPPADDDRESFDSFLYDSPVETIEFTYRDTSGRLLAVGLCDICPASMSSVYFYHDPTESRRGLGTFGVLYEIEYARETSIPYYYLGYWIKGCDAMEYKAAFQPNQVLWPDGQWRDFDRDEGKTE